MKKVITIILCLLCAISASALSYASPYKGAGRNGYIYTTSSARSKAIGGGGSMAQAPVASMGSTRSVSSRGIGSTGSTGISMPQIHVVQTSASQLAGGVTSSETYSRMNVSGPRKNTVPGYPDACPHCDWVWVGPGSGDYVCSVCGEELKDCEGYCECGEGCHCDVPVGDDWTVRIFLIVLAGAYAIYRVRTRQETIEAV